MPSHVLPCHAISCLLPSRHHSGFNGSIYANKGIPSSYHQEFLLLKRFDYGSQVLQRYEARDGVREGDDELIVAHIAGD
ncbi:unnamed protein product [Closterium sp. NIES-53]